MESGPQQPDPQAQAHPAPASMPVQPATDVPQTVSDGAPTAVSASQPVKQHVHHSYIWLGSMRSFIQAFFILLVAGFSGVVSVIGELGSFVASGGSRSGDFLVFLLIGGVVVGFLLLILGIIILFSWLSYRNLWYEIDAEEFSLYSGILSKKRVHVPYARIQSVDQRASLLQRLFGVCSVAIDTAGGAANKAIIVPYVTKAQAEYLRNELYARKAYSLAGVTLQPGAVDATGAPIPASAATVAPAGVTGAAASSPATTAPAAVAGIPAVAAVTAVPGQPDGNVLDMPAHVWDDLGGVFAGDSIAQEAPSYEYGLSNRELVFAGLSNNSGVAGVFIVIFGILAVFGQMLDVADSLDLAPYDAIEASVYSMIDSGQIMSFALGSLGFLIAIILLMWAASTVAACLRFGGFKARRRGSRIEVEQGLLQHRFQGIDVDRVQSVIVKQSFLRRLIGYCEISLGKVDAHDASSNGKQQDLQNMGAVVIHPFVKVGRVREILSGIIPEYGDVPGGGMDLAEPGDASGEGAPMPVAKRGLRRALIRRALWQGNGFWLAVCATVLWLVIAWLVDPVSGVIASEAIAEGSFTAEDVVFHTVFLSISWNILMALYALCVLLFVLDIIGAVLWWKRSNFAVNRRFMQVTNGGFSTESTYFERRKIQFGQVRTNPLQRLAHTATLTAVTAAGVGGTSITLIDVTQDDADRWLAWVEPRGNR